MSPNTVREEQHTRTERMNREEKGTTTTSYNNSTNWEYIKILHFIELHSFLAHCSASLAHTLAPLSHFKYTATISFPFALFHSRWLFVSRFNSHRFVQSLQHVWCVFETEILYLWRSRWSRRRRHHRCHCSRCCRFVFICHMICVRIYYLKRKNMFFTPFS